jgi:hypothetical protein
MLVVARAEILISHMPRIGRNHEELPRLATFAAAGSDARQVQPQILHIFIHRAAITLLFPQTRPFAAFQLTPRVT